MALKLGEEMTAEWVDKLVGEAKDRQLFKELATGKEKSRMLWLLELCAVPDRRPHAIQAIAWMGEQSRSGIGRRPQVVMECKDVLGGEVQWKQEWDAGSVQPVQRHEHERVKLLRQVVRSEPYVYDPPVTKAYAPDRHPWHGYVGEVKFMEFAAGIGVFAACFAQAGAACDCVAEPRAQARARAVKNCGGVRVELHSVMEVDPGDLGWVHGLVGGPECQPFSVAGKGRAFRDDRAYTLLRTLHIAAVMQPWWVWMENVKAIETVQDGHVWNVIQAIAEGSGYEIRLEQE